MTTSAQIKALEEISKLKAVTNSDKNVHTIWRAVKLAKAALDAAAGVKEPLPSVNWDKTGKPFSYCPECGRSEPIIAMTEAGRKSHEHFFINGICSHCGIKVTEAGEQPHQVLGAGGVGKGFTLAPGSIEISYTTTTKPITAAAETGEQPLRQMDIAQRTLVNTTIERCAQRMDELAYCELCADDTAQGSANAKPYQRAAAAIRALKDKP